MNIFKKILVIVVGSAFTLFADWSFAAPILSFENTGSNISKSYHVGDTILLDLWISGLEGTDGFGGLDLGWFDLNFSFNDAVSSYQTTIFSSDLDDSLFFGLSANHTSSNTVNNFGLSLLVDLSSQASEFKLFTLRFGADQIGTSLVKIDNLMLSDSWANELLSNTFLAEINITEKVFDVPEPGNLLLLLSALALIAARRYNAVEISAEKGNEQC